MDQGMILDFFGGVSQDGSGWAVDFDKVFYELARWLLPIGICLLTEGVWLEKQRKIEMFACHRYVTVKRWWLWKFIRSLRNGILAAAVLLIMAMAADIVRTGGLPAESWKAFVLWFVHIITIMTAFLVLDLAGLRKFAPAGLLLLEGVTFLLGFSNMGIARFMYGMWGMYFQSEWHFGETGVPVRISLFLEMALTVSGYLAGVVWLEKKVRNRRTTGVPRE